ncbi:uncharacterized protein LOC115058042 [Echeneis naucrates]|uniref:uncharacterized protein LOC115058042 n=1 Tax=Echeneis naucrates TaxID=173247 RepID=UPI0011140044|nr:uncharacterized protein LOC115058042 [Echeneis naucrates]
MRPWGRSQSLPAYANLIMRGSGSSFFNNLAATREEVNNNGTSSPKMDRSNIEDDPIKREINRGSERKKEECNINQNPLNQLDFYQADPFAHCQSDHDLFNEDLFPKTDSSDGFASDPFKGSDPFATDILFPEVDVSTNKVEENHGDEADTSLSCAENKASTGTQCFESEFPNEDSDIEISYSREDLDSINQDCSGFKPIQSSSEDLGPIQGWMSQGQYSIESDPNGYELDLGAISPPSDIEEQSVGSLAGETTNETQVDLEPGLSSSSGQMALEEVLLEPGWTEDMKPTSSCQKTEWTNNTKKAPSNAVTPQNSQNLFNQLDSHRNRELSFELSYEPTCQSSFDPYGFKLSPEHSSQTLVDPDEVEQRPDSKGLSFDPNPSSSQPDQLNFDHYRMDIASPQMVRDTDPYGFKLTPEEENQEVLDLCSHNDQEAMVFFPYDNIQQVEPSNYSKLDALGVHTHENQEGLEHCSHEELLDLYSNGNQERFKPSSLNSRELLSNENQELLDLCSHENQEVVEPYDNTSNEDAFESCNYVNQEVLDLCGHGSQDLLDLYYPENQEAPDLDTHSNQPFNLYLKGYQEVLVSGSHKNQEVLELSSNENHKYVDLGSHDNQEVLDLSSKDVFTEANNNQCIVEPGLSESPINNSSDSDVASEDQPEMVLSITGVCTTSTADTLNMAISNMSANQELAASNSPTRHNLLKGDFGSVFGVGGYIGCPDVADDLEPLDTKLANPVIEPVRPVRPVRPPRPSLKAKEKPQGIDLK